MADNDPSTPKTPGRGGWSDAERIALLVSFVESKGGPDWTTVTIPPGRTQKACQHVWTKMREEAKKADWYVAGGGKAVAASGGDGGAKGADGTGEAGGENAGALKTPKTPTSGRKRAAKSGAAEGTPSKSARKGKKGGEVEVKEEVMEDAI